MSESETQQNQQINGLKTGRLNPNVLRVSSQGTSRLDPSLIPHNEPTLATIEPVRYSATGILNAGSQALSSLIESQLFYIQGETDAKDVEIQLFANPEDPLTNTEKALITFSYQLGYDKQQKELLYADNSFLKVIALSAWKANRLIPFGKNINVKSGQIDAEVVVNQVHANFLNLPLAVNLSHLSRDEIEELMNLENRIVLHTLEVGNSGIIVPVGVFGKLHLGYKTPEFSPVKERRGVITNDIEDLVTHEGEKIFPALRKIAARTAREMWPLYFKFLKDFGKDMVHQEAKGEAISLFDISAEEVGGNIFDINEDSGEGVIEVIEEKIVPVYGPSFFNPSNPKLKDFDKFVKELMFKRTGAIYEVTSKFESDQQPETLEIELLSSIYTIPKKELIKLGIESLSDIDGIVNLRNHNILIGNEIYHFDVRGALITEGIESKKSAKKVYINNVAIEGFFNRIHGVRNDEFSLERLTDLENDEIKVQINNGIVDLIYLANVDSSSTQGHIVRFYQDSGKSIGDRMNEILGIQEVIQRRIKKEIAAKKSESQKGILTKTTELLTGGPKRAKITSVFDPSLILASGNVDKKHMESYGEGGFVTVGLYVKTSEIEKVAPQLLPYLLAGDEKTFLAKAHLTWQTNTTLDLVQKTQITDRRFDTNFKFSSPGQIERAFNEETRSRSISLLRVIKGFVESPESIAAATKYASLRQ